MMNVRSPRVQWSLSDSSFRIHHSSFLLRHADLEVVDLQIGIPGMQGDDARRVELEKVAVVAVVAAGSLPGLEHHAVVDPDAEMRLDVFDENVMPPARLDRGE